METKLCWRLAVLPIWQRSILFIIAFLILYPFEMIVLVFYNFLEFIKNLFSDIIYESKPWYKTLKLLLKETSQ